MLNFNPDRMRQLALSFCPYNGNELDHSSIVSDLGVEFLLTPGGEDTSVTILLSKYGRVYRADVDFDGEVTITDESRGGQVGWDEYRAGAEPAGKELARGKVGALAAGRATRVRFALADHALWASVGGEEIEYLGPDEPEAWGYGSDRRLLPSLALGARGGGATLRQVRVARDVHYTNSAGNERIGRATEGHPFQLGEDEFLVLGDNSPQSHDSRFWQVPGLSNGAPYTAGVVPRDYLIGRALFVYWPSGFHIPRFPLALIPNAGEMRFIN
jgi:signal peptidase I